MQKAAGLNDYHRQRCRGILGGQRNAEAALIAGATKEAVTGTSKSIAGEQRQAQEQALEQYVLRRVFI